MKKLTIALISGGISSEREVSLASGDQVNLALDKEKYDVLRYDPKTDITKLVTDAGKIDAALIILHGPYGEDGTIQGMLDLLGVPYQGAGVLGSAIAMNKLASKQLYEKNDLLVPPYVVIDKQSANMPLNKAQELGLPVVIKPVSGGSSIGMAIVKKTGDLEKAVKSALLYDTQVLVEKYIEGVEVTAGIIGNEELKALPLIEVVPGSDYEFFDYEAKYKAGATNEICPARIDDTLTARIQNYAKTAHKALFCSGYSRSDFIIKGDEVFILETNTIPGMTPTSLFPQAAKAAGIGFSDLLDRLIELALEKNMR